MDTTIGQEKTLQTAHTLRELTVEDLERVLGGEWKDLANCRGTKPDLFYPERGASTKEAKEVCRGCSVQYECLSYSVKIGEKFGIWGALSERQRRRIRRQISLLKATDGQAVDFELLEDDEFEDIGEDLQAEELVQVHGSAWDGVKAPKKGSNCASKKGSKGVGWSTKPSFVRSIWPKLIVFLAKLKDIGPQTEEKILERLGRVIGEGAATQHLGFCTEAGLVKKNRDQKFALTEFGLELLASRDISKLITEDAIVEEEAEEAIFDVEEQLFLREIDQRLARNRRRELLPRPSPRKRSSNGGSRKPTSSSSEKKLAAGKVLILKYLLEIGPIVSPEGNATKELHEALREDLSLGSVRVYLGDLRQNELVVADSIRGRGTSSISATKKASELMNMPLPDTDSQGKLTEVVVSVTTKKPETELQKVSEANLVLAIIDCLSRLGDIFSGSDKIVWRLLNSRIRLGTDDSQVEEACLKLALVDFISLEESGGIVTLELLEPAKQLASELLSA